MDTHRKRIGTPTKKGVGGDMVAERRIATGGKASAPPTNDSPRWARIRAAKEKLAEQKRAIESVQAAARAAHRNGRWHVTGKSTDPRTPTLQVTMSFDADGSVDAKKKFLMWCKRRYQVTSCYRLYVIY